MEIKPIKTERDYRKALEEIDSLMDVRPNTPQGDRLDVLVTLVELGKKSIGASTCRIPSRLSCLLWSSMDSHDAILNHSLEAGPE